MAGPIPLDYLQEGETPLVDARRHPLSILDVVLWQTVGYIVLVALALFLFQRFIPPNGQIWLWPVLLLLTAPWLSGLLMAYFRVRTSRYVVTDTRVYRAYGRIRFDLLQTTYDKVTDLHVHQSVFGRWFGFGTVTVQTAGTGLAASGVPDPFGYKRAIEQARRRFLDTLLEQHRLERPARAQRPLTQEDMAERTVDANAVPTDAGGDRSDEPLWRGGPVGWTIVPAVLSAAVMVLFAFGASGGAFFSGEPLLYLVGVGLIFFAAMSVLSAVIQYRCTRYSVLPWGVIVTSGWLTRRRVETTFDKVTDVSTYQGLLGRLFNFGNIRVNTAGSNEAAIVFNGLADPERIKQIIDDTRRQREARRR